MGEENRKAESFSLISVIIPVYNVEKYLSKCLDSVIRQTYKNLEIIVIDDGSTDSSAELCDKYSKTDSRIKVIHQKNGGLSFARNIGLSIAKGDYIGFVDADDWIHPDMYRHLIGIIEKYQADISTVEPIKVTNDVALEERYPEIKIVTFTQQEYAKMYFKIGTQKILYYVWNRLYKRELFEKNHFNKKFSIGEDVVASYKAWSKAHTIVVSNQPMYYYRQQSGMTSSFNTDFFLLTDVWDTIVELTNRRTPEYHEYAVINRNRINFTLLMELALSGEYKNKLYKKEIGLLLKNLKACRKSLFKANILLGRKIMIEAFCINYSISAAIFYFLNKIKNR